MHSMLLSEIAALTKGRLFGEDRQVNALCRLDENRSSALAVVLRRQDLQHISKCQCAGILLETSDAADLLDRLSISAVVVDDPYSAIDSILRSLHKWDVSNEVIIGNDCLIHDSVVLHKGTRIGNRVRIGAHCVIGGDGFVFRDTSKGAVRLPHFYGVVIEDDVELGSHVCVDGGMIAATQIGSRTKIDNLVQIGHDVVIGNDCTIVAQVGIAGHVRLGNNVSVGGQAGIAPFVCVGNHAQISARSALFDDMGDHEIWSGAPAMPHMHFLRASATIKTFGSRQHVGNRRTPPYSAHEL